MSNNMFTAMMILTVLYFLIYVTSSVIPKSSITPLTFFGIKVKNPFLSGELALVLAILIWVARGGIIELFAATLGSLVMFLAMFALLSVLMPIRSNNSADENDEAQDSPALNDK